MCVVLLRTSLSGVMLKQRDSEVVRTQKLGASLWSLVENVGLNLLSAVVLGGRDHLKCVGFH